MVWDLSIVHLTLLCLALAVNGEDDYPEVETENIGHLLLSNETIDIRSRERRARLRRNGPLLYMDETESCPEGYNWKWDRTTGYCYWETSFETEKLSWKEAESYCQAYGGHLASFHNLEEEKFGLSFQYGSLSHPYWIGLSLDVNTETYKWSDGSEVDYTNWAPGHPDHRDKRLRCVAMDAQEKHWFASLCGIFSWFVCKAPRNSYHGTPILPTPTPLQVCSRSPDSGDNRSYYFEDYCYFVVSETVSWHRAKQYCENKGTTLVSLHSDEEVGFILKLLYESPTLEGNRVWIGLNSLGPDGSLHWTDWTPLDFTYFNKDEPNNHQNQEKCCNMYIGNGMWNDENCNAPMGFVCKRKNDTSSFTVPPSTLDPTHGNCMKGWINHHDRCYYLGGIRVQDRVNWTTALEICDGYGGYLASIRNDKDQAFLSYLLQSLSGNAWIGLHDTIQSGRYYWVDNSDMQYTKWSPGEPSFFGVQEDCVMMVRNALDSGMWKDTSCDVSLGYICQNRKDPTLPPPVYDRGLNCLHPEGWLKLDTMCFKMFVGNDLSWSEAENACRKEGGHLVSMQDSSVRATAMYLASEINQPFWIGLRYKESEQRFSWINDWPMTLSMWDKNEPRFMTDDTCFASTPEGYWKKVSCDEEMPYICQITTGKKPKQQVYTGDCPQTSEEWISIPGSYCYILNKKQRLDFFSSTLTCYGAGAYLISIHSLQQIESLKGLLTPEITSVVRIGLFPNTRGGYMWADGSPVDFVNWDDGEPDSFGLCVEMKTDTMKWRSGTCSTRQNFICQDKKGTIVYDDPESAKLVDDSPSGLSTPAIAAVIVCMTIIIAIIVAAGLYYVRSPASNFRHNPFRQQSVSFENALYNVDRSSMEFRDDQQRT